MFLTRQEYNQCVEWIDQGLIPNFFKDTSWNLAGVEVTVSPITFEGYNTFPARYLRDKWRDDLCH